MSAQISVNVPFTENELMLLNNTMLKITKHSLNHWLTECLMTAISAKFTDYENPFVQNWKTARPTIKYFENRSNTTPNWSALTLGFAGLSQTDLNETTEIISDHNMNFWNLDQVATYLLTQLLNGSEEQFSLPITVEYQLPFKAAHNNLTFKAINKDAFSED